MIASGEELWKSSFTRFLGFSLNWAQGVLELWPFPKSNGLALVPLNWADAMAGMTAAIQINCILRMIRILRYSIGCAGACHPAGQD